MYGDFKYIKNINYNENKNAINFFSKIKIFAISLMEVVDRFLYFALLDR